MSKLVDVKMGMGKTGQKNRSRSDLKQDIMLGFGAPIIRVELTDQHLDNAINTALKEFWMHHRDGSFENYYTYVVTAEDATRGWIRIPETIDTVSTVIYLGDVGYPEEKKYVGDMSNEVIAEGIYAATHPIPPNPNNTPVSDNSNSNGIGSVAFQDKMIIGYQMQGAGTPYGYSINGSSSGNGSYVGGGLKVNPGALSQMSYADFYERQQNYQNMQSVIGNSSRNGMSFEYARYQRRLYLYFSVKANDGICIKCFENVDPDLNPEFSEVFDDETLKSMAQSLAKQTWGSILRKYGGVVLIGGVTLDGQQLYDEGVQEYNETLTALKNEQPVPFIIG